jgi:ribonuclease P/MRP protein subunit POP1
MTDNPNSKKRKPSSATLPPQKRARFPANPARNISAMPTTTAYPNGELNVSRFMRAHENEIKSLENAMKAAKKGLSRRAFQQVPRDLRRRTGSHNPQRVPKRLRIQARKEAREDNTPISKGKSGSGTGKGGKGRLRKEGIEKSVKARAKREEKKVVGSAVAAKKVKKGESIEEIVAAEDLKKSEAAKKRRKKFASLTVPDTPSSRFRRRQVNKTWLPTHIWHTKRATMTPGKEPLWRFTIPLRPAGKAYRLTHRAVLLRGAVAWDMSYMATIEIEGVEASIMGLLKALHFATENGDEAWLQRGKGKKWIDGTRIWEGWIHEREGKVPKKIAQVTVIWSVRDESNTKRKVFVRVHPSAFLHLWNEIVRVAKVQKPTVSVKDLRFEIGSIEIMGPASAETLCSILSLSSSVAMSSSALFSIWPTLASVTDVRQLPANALLAFPVSDPRLRDPPTAADITPHPQLTETLAYWPIDNTQTAAAIFSRNYRLAAGRSLSSQQSINRRKTMASPGQYPDPRPTDPQIPMLTFVSRESNCWTILLPWKCVLPVWRGIMRYPVSTGGNPRFGGLKERRQVYFERSQPSFPFDCPGTDAGWTWEQQERVERKTEWTKRPRGKRIEWTSVDLGNDRKGELGDPWACDWERLLPKLVEGSNDAEKEDELPRSPFRQMLSKQVLDLIAGRPALSVSDPHVFTVKLTMVQRGVPTTCARIYRLPNNNPELRSKWLFLMSSRKTATGAKKDSRKRYTPKSKNLPKHMRTRELAESLVEPPQLADGDLKAGDQDYPIVPDEEDLIGYVTTGNYNLAEGAPTAVANLVLHRVLGTEGKGPTEDGHVCIVREAGHALGRLAKWEFV